MFGKSEWKGEKGNEEVTWSDSFIPTKRTKDGKHFIGLLINNVFTVEEIEEEEDELSVEDNNDGRINDLEANNGIDESDVEEVLETLFDQPDDQKDKHSEDPFGLYPLLNKENIELARKVTEEDRSLSHPPGFTPEEGLNKGNTINLDMKYYGENERDDNSFVNLEDGKDNSESVCGLKSGIELMNSGCICASKLKKIRTSNSSLKPGVSKELVFPRMFALELNKNATVSSKLNASSLDNSFRRKARSGIEEMQLNSLAEISRMTTLVPCEDRYVWTLESDGGSFSCGLIRKGELMGNRFQDVNFAD
ncbi:hypothetical protein Tco_0788439 [Tanacetum coccineum]